MKIYFIFCITIILLACGSIYPSTTMEIEETNPINNNSLDNKPTSIIIPSATLSDTSNPTETNTAIPSFWTYLGPDGTRENESSNDQVRIVAIDPILSNTIYIGVQDRGLLKSIDRGKTWVDIIPQDYANPSIIAIDPKNTSTIYYIDIPIMKSSNGGAKWSDAGILGSGQGDYQERVDIRSFAINQEMPEILFAGVDLLGGIPSGIMYKSENGGNSWSPISLPNVEMVLTIAIDPKNTQTVYAGTEKVGIFKSTDGGENWRLLPSGISQDTIHYIAIDPITTDTIYASTNKNGLIKSDDGGENWRTINRGIPDKLEIPKIILNKSDNKNLYIYTLTYSPDKNTSLLMSNDAGGRWIPINLGDKSVNDIALDTESPPILYIATDKGLYSMDNN